MISVLGREHVVPGATAAHAPCESRNGGARAVDEVIDFSPADGGFVNLWRQAAGVGLR